MISIRTCHNQFNNIIKKGIKMGFSDERDQKQAAAKVLYLINATAGNYCAGFDGDSDISISIETTYCDPVLTLEFTNEGLHFIPLVDTTWKGAFFEVMRILYSWEGKKIDKEDSEQKECKGDEPDFEWI